MSKLKTLRVDFVRFVEQRWKSIRVPFDDGSQASESAAANQVGCHIKAMLIEEFAPIAYKLAAALGNRHFKGMPGPLPYDLNVRDAAMYQITGHDCRDTLEAGQRLVGWGAWAFDPRNYSQVPAFERDLMDWGESNLYCSHQRGDVSDDGQPYRRPRHQHWDWVLEFVDVKAAPARGRANKKTRQPGAGRPLETERNMKWAKEYVDGLEETPSLWTTKRGYWRKRRKSLNERTVTKALNNGIAELKKRKQLHGG